MCKYAVMYPTTFGQTGGFTAVGPATLVRRARGRHALCPQAEQSAVPTPPQG